MQSQVMVLVAIGYLTLSVAAAAQEKPARQGGSAGDAKSAERTAPPEDAFGENWQPGPEHKVYESLLGKWTFLATVEPSPGSPVSQSKGSAEYRRLLGGRFVMEEVKLDLGGQTFEWIGIYGYDTIQKKYTAVWIDNGGTETEIGSGTYDPATKKIAFSGDQFDPRTGGRSKFRWVIGVGDKDRVSVEMYEPGPDGKEVRMLEIVGSR